MAPPTSRRSTQNSTTPSPIPLPGVALGLFAAVAAGFAASRALRRRNPAQRLQDEQQSMSANDPFEEREIEIKEGGDSSNSINANGTITLAQEPSKLAAGSLKPVFDAIEEVSFVQEGDEIPSEEEDEAEKWEEKDCGGEGQIGEADNGVDLEENEEKGETMKNGKTNEEEGESAEVIVEIEASVAMDDVSVKELQRSILEKAEAKDEREAGIKRTGVEGIGVVVNGGDICDDDERISADQQPSPVLINGKTLDSFEETLDNKDESDVISSGSNSLSDGVSESSTQELSSAPVRPFVPTEETLEASRPGAKPADLNQSAQETTLPEDKKWSCIEPSFPSVGDGLPETTRKLPEFAENVSPAGKRFSSFKHDQAVSNNDVLQLKAPERDVDAVLLNSKPVWVEIKKKEPSGDKENQVKFDLQSDVMDVKGNSAALEGKVPTEGNGLDEGLAESTALHVRELSSGSSFLKELGDCESVGESEHAVQTTREAADDFTGLQYKGEDAVEPAHINGEVPCEESVNNLDTVAADETSLQTGQEGTDNSDLHSNPDLQAGSGLSGNKTRASSENDVYDSESTQENGESTEECAIVDNVLEEPEQQPAVLYLDHVGGTTAENNVKLKQEQSNLLVSSRGVSEGLELSCEGSRDSSNGEVMGDGLAGEVLFEERTPTREQEIEATTSSCELSDRACEEKERIPLTDSAQGRYNRTREADDLVVKGAVHQHGLQPKGVSVSRALEYLPLEIGFICLLMALISSILWYLEMLPDFTINKLMSISN